MDGSVALKKAKNYVDEVLKGNGSIKGNTGDPGKDGKDAPTITNVSVDENNVLSTTLSDGTVLPSGIIPTVAGKNGIDGVDGITPHIDPTTKHWFTGTTDTGIVAEGKDGIDGIQGIRGEKGDPGEPGQQGLQGIKGDKGDDGYPFLIYKEYADVSEFSADDFPEIGLLFMIKVEDATNFPVYRYTGEEENPYSFVTNLSGSEGIKGDKGDPGQDGEQGIPGQNGADGTTYTPTIGTVTSLQSNQNPTASVLIDEDTQTVAFNFGIPKGENGSDGKDGENGTDGEDGFSPTITENENNTEDNYKLDITNKDNTFTTPNLMGVIGMEYKNKSVGTPVGEIISYMGTIAPTNYLICNGILYQIADYPYLAQHFIDNFGSANYFGGDGTSTFAVPDLRGEFLRGAGTASRNTGSGLSVGKHQDATKHINFGVSAAGSLLTGGKTSIGPGNMDSYESTSGRRWTSLSSSGNDSTNKFYTSRPTNTSVLYCIKYQPTYWITKNNGINNNFETVPIDFTSEYESKSFEDDE